MRPGPCRPREWPPPRPPRPPAGRVRTDARPGRPRRKPRQAPRRACRGRRPARGCQVRWRGNSKATAPRWQTPKAQEGPRAGTEDRGRTLPLSQRDPGQHHQDHGGADEGGEIRVRGLDADLGREPPSAWRRRRQQRPELPKRKNGSHGAAPRTGRAGSSVRAAFRPPAGRRPRRGGGVPVARALVLSRDGAQGPHPGRPCPADRRRGVPPVQPSCAVVAAGAAAWARARAARRRSSGCRASARASATAA